MLIHPQNGDTYKIIPFISEGELVFHKEIGKYILQKEMNFSTLYDNSDLLRRIDNHHRKHYYNDSTEFVKFVKQYIFAIWRNNTIYFIITPKHLAEMIMNAMRDVVNKKLNPFVSLNVVIDSNNLFRYNIYDRSVVGNWEPEFDHSSPIKIKEFISEHQTDSIDDYLSKKSTANNMNAIINHYGIIYESFMSKERDKKINNIIS